MKASGRLESISPQVSIWTALLTFLLVLLLLIADVFFAAVRKGTLFKRDKS